MPLFHRGHRDARIDSEPTDTRLADDPILAHDRKGRLRRGRNRDRRDTSGSPMVVGHQDTSFLDPGLRTYTYGGKQYAYYYDPSFHYGRGHERDLSVHPNDVTDPYLRMHLKEMRRKAQHGQLGPNDPLLVHTLPPTEERLDLFEPGYMGPTSRRRYAEDELYAHNAAAGETRSFGRTGRRDTPTGGEGSRSLGSDDRRLGTSRGYDYDTEVHRYPRGRARAPVGTSGRSSSLYRPIGRFDSVFRESVASGRSQRSSSVPAQRTGGAHTRIAYSTADALPYGTASRAPSTGPSGLTSSPYGRSGVPLVASASTTHLSTRDHGAGFADLITDRTEPVTFHPTSAGGAGTLECDHGAHVRLGAKQSLPYNPKVPTTTTIAGPPLANRTVSAPATGVVFHRESLTAAHIPEHTTLSRTGAGGTYDRRSTTGRLGSAAPTTTVAALDRANRIALAEAEANRPVAYTKVGPVTFVHDQDRRQGNLSRMATLNRARVLGAGRTHTTTEMAILRSNAIASAEMAREQERKRAVTKIGSLLTLSR